MTVENPSSTSPGGAASDAEAPILILSCYRTGSTLLRYIVDTHPDIYSPPEVYLGQAAYYLTHFAAGLRGLRYDMELPESMTPEMLEWLRATLGGEMRAAAARKGKKIWCEKTPSNMVPMNLAVLERVFPDARYLCLHRHSLDVVQSLIKIIHRLHDLQPFLLAAEGNVLAAAVDYWNLRTKALLQIEYENPSRCFRLRYEDLVAAPSKVLEPMFRFLGVSWDESLVSAVFKTQHDRGMDDHYISFTSSIHTESLGAGSGLSLEGVPEEMLETMRSLLQILDYPEVLSPASSAAKAASIPEQGVQWFFETHLPARVQAEPELCGSLSGSYQFAVTDEEGTWVLDPQQGRVIPGQDSANCRIEVASADLFAIARGELHPWKAAEQQRLRLSGEVQIRDLEKLVRLLHL